MTDTTKPSADAVTGQMFLYEKPELLTPEQHGTLGLTPSNTPYAYAAGIRVVPLTQMEFSSAGRHYPIVFASVENPVPLAVVGVLEDVNLFVSGGKWDVNCYVPSYLRCYPFAFAAADDGRVAVVVDRAASIVTDNPRYPFFENGKLASQAESMMQFCAQYEKERAATRKFCDRLRELDLLTTQQATYRPDGATEDEVLAGFTSIDARKLPDFDAPTVHQLHKDGMLQSIYLQLYSLENWRSLIARRMRRAAAGSA